MEFGIPCLVGVENQQMDEEFFCFPCFWCCVQKTVKIFPPDSPEIIEFMCKNGSSVKMCAKSPNLPFTSWEVLKI